MVFLETAHYSNNLGVLAAASLLLSEYLRRPPFG